jgi:hypothetical protein
MASTAALVPTSRVKRRISSIKPFSAARMPTVARTTRTERKAPRWNAQLAGGRGGAWTSDAKLRLRNHRRHLV